MRTYIHTCAHTYITYTTYITYMTYIYAYIHTYMTDIPTYRRTYIHTYGAVRGGVGALSVYLSIYPV